jgi:hypothetical protein
MSAFEMYDKLPTISPTVDQTLAIAAQGEISEEGGFSQKVSTGDDGSEHRCNLGSTTPKYFCTFGFNALSESDMGTIHDLYFDSAKAFGMLNSFKWSKRGDGHTYVVRFANELLARNGRLQRAMGCKEVKLRILGRIVD